MRDSQLSYDPGDGEEEAVLPLPVAADLITHATQFRTTWIVSSLESLRAVGHYERYVSSLREHRDEILSCVAGMWVPIEVARTHYRTCDALALSEDVLALMTRGPGGQVRRNWHATLIAAAQRPGANAWSVLPQLNRIWQRSADGGAVAVYRLGERLARVDYVGCELFDIPYFRQSVNTIVHTLGSHFCDRLTVQNLPQKRAGESQYLMRWL